VGLAHIVEKGGQIPCVDVVVCRAFPFQFLETLPNGERLILSEDEEMNRRTSHERELEEAYQKLAKESEKAALDGLGSHPDREELIQEANVC
jgi:hypothetical protein